MNRDQLILLGTAIQIIGALTVFLRWASITYEDAYGWITVSYTGISFLTSGDFEMCLGIATPLLVCIAFAAMLLRFLVRIDRGYLVDVGIAAALIILGSMYMMFWIGPGDYVYPDHIEYTSVGIGAPAALVIALISVYLAYCIDKGGNPMPFQSSPKDAGPAAPQSSQGQRYDLYCPSCGTGILLSPDGDVKYCPGCGMNVESLLPEKERDFPPEEPRV